MKHGTNLIKPIIEMGPKVTSFVARGRCAQHLPDVRALHDAHRTRILRVTFAWHMRDSRHIHAGCARHIRESDANVARTCRTRSAQQEMLLLDLSDLCLVCVAKQMLLLLLLSDSDKFGLRYTCALGLLCSC
jgi:hypothetical protein